MNYEQIAYELDEELTGNIQFCDWDNRPCILWSEPSKHPNIRYNPNNVVILFVDEYQTKEAIKVELLSYYWAIEEAGDYDK